MNIQITEVRLLPDHKATRAFVDLEIDGITFRDFRVMQNGSKSYVKAPFSTYKNQNGELCFRQIVDFPAEVRGRIDNAILSAFYREKETTDGKQK